MGNRCNEEVAGGLSMASGRLAALCLASVGCVSVPALAAAQDEPHCVILCAPELKIEPTWTIENLGGSRSVEVDGQVESVGVESAFELVLALDIPTTIPRVGFTFETIFAPFVQDNSVEIESEINFQLLDTDQTGGWVSSHVDVVDQFSPGETPRASNNYTHKLDFEWDTAFHLFNRLPKGHWLRNVEAEVSLDYLASGLPKAGDVVGGERFLDDANPWSFSLLMIPLAPLAP
jgi:hypothetical protein